MSGIQNDDNLPPDDLLNINDACLLVPSPRTGRRTHVATVYRWIMKGKLRAWRRGRWLFVSRAEVLTLLRPVRVQVPQRLATAAEIDLESRRRAAWADKTLRELGMRGDDDGNGNGRRKRRPSA